MPPCSFERKENVDNEARFFSPTENFRRDDSASGLSVFVGRQLFRQHRALAAAAHAGLAGQVLDRRRGGVGAAGGRRRRDEYPARADCRTHRRRDGRQGRQAKAGHVHSVFHGGVRLRLRVDGQDGRGGGVARVRLRRDKRRLPVRYPADATGAHRRRRPAPHAGERIRHERPHDSRNAGGRPVRGRDSGRVFGLLLELRHRVAAVRRDDSGVRPDADAVRVRAPARRRGAAASGASSRRGSPISGRATGRSSCS